MTPKQFIKSAEDLIYKEVAKNTNLLLGKNKTAGLSTGLFLQLPIEVTLNKADKPINTVNKNLNDMVEVFGAYVSSLDTTKVNMTFMYHTEKDLVQIEKHLHRHGVFFAFVYLHEVQHILRKHTTHSYNTMMLRIASKVKCPHHVINIAEDHAINYSLKDLFNTSVLSGKWDEIEKIGMYNKKYHDNQMSDIEILKDLVANAEEPEVSQMSSDMDSVTMDGKTSIQPNEGMGNGSKGSNEKTGKGAGEDKAEKGGKCSTTTDDLDKSLSDLADSLKDVIQSNTKGTQAGELFNQLFESVKVDIGWFSKLKKSFKRIVFYKTHDYSTSWANLNNIYRRIYKSPKKQFIADKMELVLSIDHSFSASTESLQKLLYLMEETSKSITKVTVLVHDTRIVKEFVVEDEYDLANSKEFKEAFATRFAAGGTSHSEVFNWLDTNIKRLDKSIYISYSDNYSDIQQEWAKHPKLRGLTTYFVCTEHNPINVKGTTDILMV